MSEKAMQELRRRGARRLNEIDMFGDSDDEMKFSKTLKRFDAFAEVNKDVVMTSGSGGVTLSIITWILVIMLSLNEFALYWEKRNMPTEHLTVDTSIDEQLQIEMNITFWDMHCSELHVCAMDAVGENHLFIDNDMTKHRLSSEGIALGKPLKAAPNYNSSYIYCGSCYAATKNVEPDKNGSKCCNTCNEVIDAYINEGLDTRKIMTTAEQCHHNFVGNVNIYDDHPREDKEGCNLSGRMKVNKVAGNIHMAMGESSVKSGHHIHMFDFRDSPKFNISHTIHKLSFGVSYPGKPPDALDGMVQILDKETGTGPMKYFINVVPTQVYNEDKKMVTSSQYSYAIKYKSIYGSNKLPGSFLPARADNNNADEEPDQFFPKKPLPTVLPGLFFIYDITPFSVTITYANEMPLTRLIIRLCAISGGIVTISHILNSAFTALVVYIARKGVFLPS